MKECPVCRRCFPDHVNHCPDDGDATTQSIMGEPILDGRYQLEKRLGHGGMGVVFQARHIFLKTAHAIKVILPDLVGNDPMLITRFRQEALAAAAIRHQNIIAVTDFGVVRGTMPFLVMEYVSGQSLHDRIAEEGALAPARALEIIAAIGAGVSAAHRQGIVHRDLKPLNIMFQENMPVAEGLKVLDFGLAKIKSGELLGSFVQAKTSGLMGSPFYMAPEQWGDEEPDARADIYSLGVILFQMLGGDVPFKGTSIPSIMKKHLTQEPPTFASLGVQVPPEIERVVRHALEKEAENRPASVEEFVRELSDAVAALSASLRRTTLGVFIPQEQSVVTPQGATSIPPDATTLKVRTRPAGARVYINNVSVGSTDDTGMLVVPDMLRGLHRVQIMHDGYAEWAESVECRGGVCEIEAQLQNLAETSIPPASVYGHQSLGDPYAGTISSGSLSGDLPQQSHAAMEAQRLRQQAEVLEEQARQEEEARRREQEAERERQLAAAQEEARRQAEEEERLRLEAQKQRQAEEEAARLKAEEEEAARRLEAAAEEERRRAQAEAERLRAEEERRLELEAQARQQAQEEAARKLAAEEERARAEEARLKAEEEARLAAEAQRRAAEEAKRQAEEEEARREAARKAAAAEEEARQRAAEKAAEQERLRLEAVAAERQRAETEERERQRAEEEAARLRAVELAREREVAAASEREARLQKEREEQAARIAATINPEPLPQNELDSTQGQRQGIITQQLDEESLSAEGRAMPRWRSGQTSPNVQPVSGQPTQYIGSTHGAAQAPRRSGLSTTLIAAIVGVLLIGGGLGVWYMTGSKPENEIGANQSPTPTPTVTATATPAQTQTPGQSGPPVDVYKPELIAIPGGRFQMGRDGGAPQEGPVRDNVVINSFSMDKTEVTNGEYAEFVRSTGHTPPSHWGGEKPAAGTEMLPVVNVSYQDAVKFAEWRSKRDGVKYRLPTEEEWEYAARGGDQGNTYPWGGEWVQGHAGTKDSGATAPKPVGSYPQDKTRWGVLDMAGNVYEWTSSRASLYPGNDAQIDPSHRSWVVVRGGSYLTDYRQKPPTTFRDWFDPSRKESVIGFRLVRLNPATSSSRAPLPAVNRLLNNSY
jgi:formylglycine-generating enzyme required for sulfatase activity/serine/threonine protein kinase